MKALLVLVLLSMVSTANAAVEMSCYAEGLTKRNTVTMLQEGKNFKITNTRVLADFSKKVETTNLYTQGKPERTSLGDMIYSGIAETQVQVDVFRRENFRVVVPLSLERKVTAAFSADHGDGLEPAGEYSFKCVKADNR